MQATKALIALALATTGCARADIPHFDELDVNGDGRIGLSEAERNAQLRQAFASVDSNGDGQLSAGEYLEAVNKR